MFFGLALVESRFLCKIGDRPLGSFCFQNALKLFVILESCNQDIASKQASAYNRECRRSCTRFIKRKQLNYIFDADYQVKDKEKICRVYHFFNAIVVYDYMAIAGARKIKII